jgi:HTH-type transcriptional regulator, global nitrogen regulator NrpRI
MNGLISPNVDHESDSAGSARDGRTVRARLAILQALDELGESAGAQKIAEILHENGIDLQARSIRFHLQKMDQDGLTHSAAKHEGRQITETGSKELARNNVMGKVGFISSRMDELGYRMSFDVETGTGNVISNVTYIKKTDLSRSIHYLKPVFASGLSMGDRIAVRMPGAKIGSRYMPHEKIIISTICSVSINGILLKGGIPVISRFGGLVEMVDGKPKRFIELVEYHGTSIDPHKMFIMANMTGVNRFAATGNGIVGVSFREFPSAANEKVKSIISTLAKLNLNGVLAVGHPNRPLLDIRVGEGRTAMITIDGLNPIAALHEAGIPIELNPLSGLEELSDYVPFSEVAPMERRGAYVE